MPAPVVVEVLVVGFEHAEIDVVLGGRPGVFAEQNPVLIAHEPVVRGSRLAAEFGQDRADLGVDVRIFVEKSAQGAYSHIKCDGLMMDDRSESHAYPYNDVSGEQGSLNYEATVSKIDEDQLFYLQCRGLSEDEAKLLIVNGFCEGVVRDLNVEYSVEMTRLIRMILEDGNAIQQD